jgi:thiol-disulfide isomerase/thioredoxin
MAELTAAAADDSEDGRRDQRRRATLAILSPLAGAAAFAYSRSSPADPVTVLRGMEGRSPTLQAALESGRPTVVEFYAQWCKDCKAMATSVDRLERRFDEKVNFVVLDAEKDENAKLVGLFRVDAIPHFAFISPERKLLTTLTGSRVFASRAF